MSFVASAIRYRPQQWADVLGQPVTVRILQNAVRLKRIAPAYIFEGQKGCGKTSIARLLAKTLNCASVPQQVAAGAVPEPCGACISCCGITTGRDPDVLEIDAASYGGIEDAREVQQIAQQQPRAGAWRIIILDEAHSLSKAAQQAMLALLEAPPERFLPIFCTTDAVKILPAVASRCSTFLIRPLPVDAIVANLQRIFDDARQPVELSVLHALARNGDGSLRDVQQLADQLIICAAGEPIDDTFAEAQAGLVTQSLFRNVAGALTVAWQSGPAAWFDEIGALYADGIDMRAVFFQVIPTLLRDLRVSLVSRGRPQSVVPYDSGIPHSAFEARNCFSHKDLDVLFAAWESQAEYFGTLNERTNVEFFFLTAWSQQHDTAASENTLRSA
jgi:DNA polymerase-3 subunit gamma/tau